MKISRTRASSVVLLVSCVAMLVFCHTPSACGEVLQSSNNGFQVKQVRVVNLSKEQAFEQFVEGFSKWYDASHSYSLNSDNLSIDLGKHCMLEKLPDGGFVSHMEVVFYQPGKMLRMTGGLGPLQGMGVNGALTFQFEEAEDGRTNVTMIYNVSGAEFLNLKQLAAPVDAVLGSQVDSFQKHCEL